MVGFVIHNDSSKHNFIINPLNCHKIPRRKPYGNVVLNPIKKSGSHREQILLNVFLGNPFIFVFGGTKIAIRETK